MLLLKKKNVPPSQKHRNSHGFIHYKKTLDNVVKSVQKNTVSTKKIQHIKSVENVYFDMKTDHNSEKYHHFHSNNAMNEKREKKRILKNPFHIIDKTQRKRSHSHKKGHDLFMFRHNTDKNPIKESPVNKASTKNSSSTQNSIELIKQLMKQNDFYKYKCYQSEQKLNQLEQKFYQQKRMHKLEKESYEERLRKMVRSPQNGEKQQVGLMTFKRAVQGNHSNEDIEYKHLHKLRSNHGKDETQRHSPSILSEQILGRKFFG